MTLPYLTRLLSVNTSVSRKRLSVIIVTALLPTATPCAPACTPSTEQSLTTIADARDHPATVIDIGVDGDSPGDLYLFDQPLLDADQRPIGTNSGFCIRIVPGQTLQCQWTLTLALGSAKGSIQVAGREADQGTSGLAIVGGSGAYRGISGDMRSTNNGDGTFTQVLRYVTDGDHCTNLP